MKRVVSIGVAVVFSVALTASIGCEAIYCLLDTIEQLVGNHDQQTAEGPCYSDILAAADGLAKEQNPNAVVFEVVGDNVGILEGTGARTMTYVFLAADSEDGMPMWRLTYDRLQDSWRVEELNTPIVGVVFIDLTEIEMTEEDARALLTANGFAEDFLSWGLSQVLYPGVTNPVFSFLYSNQTISIDAIEGAVTYQVVNPGGVGDANPSDDELPAAPGDDSVSVQMIHAATEEIQRTARSAFVFWAGGRDADGGDLNQPGDTNYWDFNAVANLDTDPRTWTMAYDGAWHITEVSIVPFGIELIDIRSVTMDVVEAWALAVDAGYFPPFQWWAVFKPLDPDALNPLYVFGTPYAYVFVDTVTGEVSAERSTRNALGDCLYGCRESYLECVDYCRWAEPGVGDCYEDCADSRDRCDRDCYEDND